MHISALKNEMKMYWTNTLFQCSYCLIFCWIGSWQVKTGPNVIVLRQQREGGERRGAVYCCCCCCSTYISGSEDSVMRAGTTLWATSVSFTPFTSSWSDWTEPAVMSQRWAGHLGQERATPAINREKKKGKKQNKEGKERKRKQTQKDRKKVIYNDKNNSCEARNGTVCFKQVCTHTLVHTRTHTHAISGMHTWQSQHS